MISYTPHGMYVTGPRTGTKVPNSTEKRAVRTAYERSARSSTKTCRGEQLEQLSSRRRSAPVHGLRRRAACDQESSVLRTLPQFERHPKVEAAAHITAHHEVEARPIAINPAAAYRTQNAVTVWDTGAMFRLTSTLDMRGSS